MLKRYKDYLWKEGIPYGTEPTEEEEGYKIAMDPYRKRISIEKYSQGQFTSIIYDSALFDFRHLKQEAQTAWQKSIVKEDEREVVAMIRNQDDRLILIETYAFEGELCRRCVSHSPHGVLVSRQQLYYKALGDAFNGVILFDANQKPVMRKRYEIDPKSNEFTQLLEEEWNVRCEIPYAQAQVLA